jgi:hypothetical protein
MTIFEIQYSGELSCKWPNETEIRLLDCKFSKGLGKFDFHIHTEVKANNSKEARQIGFPLCQDAVNLLEFCMDEPVHLKQGPVNIREKGSNVTTGLMPLLYVDIKAVRNDMPTKEQLEAISKAQNTIESERDDEKKEALIRAIHWQARGRREKESKIDRFLYFWIALEVLVKGEGEKVVGKIKDFLSEVYPDVNKQKISEIVGRIYGVRADIVHFGVRQPSDLDVRVLQLEKIVADLLRKQLGLKFKALSEQVFR